MQRGEVWWVLLDEKRPVLLLSDDEPSKLQAMQVVAAAGEDISGLGIEVAIWPMNGLAFDGVVRLGYPHPGFTPCTWLTTVTRDDLIELVGVLPAEKLNEVEDAIRAASEPKEWTPDTAARFAEIKDALRSGVPEKERLALGGQALPADS